MPRKMRAALFAKYGGPEVVDIGKVPIPEPGPGEVRIKIEASAMNHLDLWVRRGLPIETPMPHIGGSDMAGVVDAVGPGSEAVPVGTRVVVDPSVGYEWYLGQGRGPSIEDPRFHILGEHTQGGFAEYAVVPARQPARTARGLPGGKSRRRRSGVRDRVAGSRDARPAPRR